VILNATDEYRGEMDVLGNFLKERCIQGKEISIRIRELYKAYADWCDDNKEHAVSERFFSMRLKEMNFTQNRTSEARFWVGVGLKVRNEEWGMGNDFLPAGAVSPPPPLRLAKKNTILEI
jgi:putative DNA primase/helicase